MKQCIVHSTTVDIPVLPEIRWWDHPVNPTATVEITTRRIRLTPHVVAMVPVMGDRSNIAILDDREQMAAYDRETDTLFIKE